MTEVNQERFQAVYEYVVSQGDQINTWPSMAEIIATAIEVALSHDKTTTNN